MSSLDADVRIVLNAEDRASGTVDVAAKRINTSYRDMRRQQNALGQSFELNHRTISQSLRGIQAFGNAANRLIGVYQAWNIQQIRNSQTSKDLKTAQDELNDAILEYGINSDQAKEAQEKVNQLMEESKQNALNTAANYVLIGTAVAGMATSIIKKGIPALMRLGGLLGKTSATVAVGSAGPLAGAVGGAAETGAATGVLSKLGGVAGKAAGVGVGSALTIGTMMGEQQAGETSIPDRKSV